MNEYELDLAIDETALDIEWLRQPELMMKYIKKQSEAQKEYELKDQELKILVAGLDRSIREDPEKFGIEKLTEGSVDSAIKSRPSYKKLKKELIDCQYEWNMCNGAVSAFHQKRAALESLVKLHGMGYFAGPSVPRDLVEERQQKETKRQNEIKSIKIKRRK